MNEKITADRIIELMMEKTSYDQATMQTFVGELTALVNDSLIRDGSTRVKGVGKFRIVPVKERESVNPSGERIVVPAHHWLSFLPDKFLKDRINKPFAFFDPIEAGEGGAPTEQPEDAEREYVDNNDSPTDEVAQRERFSAISMTAEETAKVNTEEEDVEPVTLINSEWNNKNQNTMNREIKKDIAEGWSEGRSVGSRPETVGERAAAHLRASEIITPEVADKADELEYRTLRKEISNEPQIKVATMIPSVTPPPPQPQQAPKRDEKQPKSNIPLYVVLALLLLLLFGGLFYHYFYYLPSSNSRATGRETENKVVTSDTFVLPGEEAADKDAADADRKGDADGVKKEGEENVDPATVADKARRAAVEVETKEKAKADDSKEKNAATPKRKVLASVKLEPGQYLTKLAEKYYGNKVFWVYIYDFNKSKIADPNHIPTNMEIKIPAKEIYGINANSSASVEKAKAIQSRLATVKK